MIETVFLQKDLNLNINNDVNIILSPELYWIRIFELPIDSKKEALNVLPNMFEEFFPIEGYKFYIEKTENGKYISFAYNEQEIKKIIEDVGLSLKQVANIYFSQFECEEYDSFSVNGISYMYQDNLLVQIPKSFVLEEQLEELDLNSVNLSKHSFHIDKSSKYIETKTAYILSGLFILFALGVFVKSYIVSMQSTHIPFKIEKIKKEYQLMPTLFQTKALLKEYEKLDVRYMKIRDAFEYCINFKHSLKGIIEKIELKNNQITVIYSKATFSDVKMYMDKKYNKTDIKKLANTIRVRISL